ncbi:MAG: SLBB domain-containing protein [bacterium]|nr:SLBB domain-containing protein [bacterium]
MKRIPILTLFVIVCFFEFVQAQDDIQIGSSGRTNATGALYDYSNASTVNIKVQLWGYLENPGYYIVPAGTSLNELISLAGGPLEDASLDDIRVVRIKEGSPTTMVKYNYDDLVWQDKITNKIEFVTLNAGDIVIVPGEPRYFAREDVTFYLGILTSLASIAALVISIILLTSE